MTYSARKCSQAVVISFFVHVGIINADSIETESGVSRDTNDPSYWSTQVRGGKCKREVFRTLSYSLTPK